jgi:hypothetical protein
MSSESELVINVWETFKDFVPASKRGEYAIELVRSFAEYGFEHDDLSDIVDEDDDLTDAYSVVFEDEINEDLDDE